MKNIRWGIGAVCCMAILLSPSAGHARVSCRATFDASAGTLTIQSVSVGSVRYQVMMALEGNYVFSLVDATVLNSADCYDSAIYASEVVTIPDVKAGDDYYYADLTLVPGSNPMRFALRSAIKNPRLVPEAAIRVNNASNPFATVAVDGTAYVGYSDLASGEGGTKFQSSADGLRFGNPTVLTYSNRSVDSRRTLMPDGVTWRFYEYNQTTASMTSYSSTDGNSFTADSGVRYAPHASDNNTIGVYDHYTASDGSVVMIYVGDLTGKNNLRMARSTDNGLTFTFLKGNVLGDDDAGGGGGTFIDNKTILLPDGRRRMFAMRSFELYSFISTDGVNWTREPGVRVSYTDFAAAGLTIYSLNDPVPVSTIDGVCRVYVAAATSSTAMTPGSSDWAIVSAVWRE